MVFLNRTSPKFPLRGGSSTGGAWKFRMRHACHRPRIGSTAACPPARQVATSLPHRGPPSDSRRLAAQCPGRERLSPGGHVDRGRARTDRGREAEDPETDAVGRENRREARLAGQGRSRTELGDCGTELVASAVTTQAQGSMGGREMAKVNPRYTSYDSYRCGARNDPDESNTCRCGSCGPVADGEVNSAINIPAAGVPAAGASTWAVGPCVAPEPCAGAT